MSSLGFAVQLLEGAGGTPPITSGYPLADDGTVAGLFGVGHIAYNSPIYNVATYAYQDPAIGNQSVGTPDLTAFFSTQALTIPSANTLACEFEITTPPTTQFGDIKLAAVYLSAGFSVVGIGTIGISNDGSNWYKFSGHADVARTDTTNVRIGLVLDGNLGLGYYVWKEDPTTQYTFTLPPTAVHVVFINTIEDSGTTPNTETTLIKLVPNAANMTALYPVNCLDFDGQTCPVNGSWNPPQPPTILTAETDTVGNQQTITFNEPITGSPQSGWSWKLNGNTYTPSGYSQPTSSTNSIGFSTHAIATDDLTVSYDSTVGNTVSVATGLELQSFTDMPVTNNVTPVLNCGYPFPVAAGGMVMSNLDMTGTYTLGFGTHSNVTASPYDYPNSPYYTVINDGSIKVFEFSPDALTVPVSGTIQEIIIIADNGGSSIGSVGLLIDSSGFYQITTSMTSHGNGNYNLGTTKPSRIGMEFDSTSNTFRTYVDNVLIDSRTYSAYAIAVLRMNIVASSITAPDVGIDQTMTVYTYATDFTNYVYSTGAVDFCGDVVGGVQCPAPYTIADAGISLSNFGEAMALGTTVTGTNSYAAYNPYTTNYWDTPYTFAIGTGTHVIEFETLNFPHTVGGAAYWQLVANFTDTAGNVVGYVTLEAQSTGYNIQLYMTLGPSSSSYSIGSTLPSRFSVAFEAAGPTVRVYVDGTQRLTATYALADDPIIISKNIETVNLGAPDAGTLLWWNSVPGASNMTGTNYPSGATDNCGNTV